MFTIKTMVYPKEINARVSRLRHARVLDGPNAVATAGNFSCGSFVRFAIAIESRVVAAASFSSNGCAFTLAAADELADYVTGKDLSDLHGLAEGELSKYIGSRLGEFPIDRSDCAASCIEALRTAFANHRARQIEEFQGEKALICTCFGVSEDTVETLIAKNSLTTVDQVARECNAGSGCGSCRMLIHEMLDDRSGCKPATAEK